MKFIRILWKLLLLVFVIAAIAVAVAFVPDVQTWLAQRAIAKHPELHLSLGAISAGLGNVAVEDLRFEHDGAILTVPTLEAGLPLLTALRTRKLSLQRLIAKGWTLDLRPTPESLAASTQPTATSDSSVDLKPTTEATPPPSEKTSAADKAADAFKGLLSGWKFPCDVSAEGIELEGDVLVPVGRGKERERVHLTLTGGGLGAGHDGVLAMEAKAIYLGVQIVDLAAHGTVTVSMDTPRSIHRVEIKSALSAKSVSPPEGLTLAVDLTAARVSGEETYAVDISREDRHLLTVSAHLPPAKQQLAGRWKIDLQNADLGPFTTEHVWPDLAANGEGEFDGDTAFAGIHAVGHLTMRAHDLGVLTSTLGRVGNVTLNTTFEAARDGDQLHVAHIDLSLDGPQPVATARSLQAFTLDLSTGAVGLAEPRGDWMEGSIKGLPLNWLTDLAGWSFASGNLTGEFSVQASPAGFAVRPKAPFTASAISVQHAGIVVARDLDLSVSLLADKSAQTWQVRCSPLTVSSAGREIATFEAKATPSSGASPALVIAGTWKADLEALSLQPEMTGLRAIAAHAASGDFSASLGARTKLETSLSIVQQDAAHTLTAKLSTELGKDHAVTFHAPVKLTAGTKILELTTDGTVATFKGAHQISVRLVGKDVDLEDLRLLAPLIGMANDRPPATEATRPIHRTDTPTISPEPKPFWGDTIGHIYIAVDRLKTGSSQLEEVRGTFKLDPRSLRLENAQYQLADRHLLGAAEGSISFDPAVATPYALKMKLDDGELDAASVFGTPPAGEDPAFHGRFSIATTLAGSGASLSDLISHTQQTFRLKSTGGIVRLLKTHVTGLAQDKESTAGNVADTVGTLVGKLAGLNKNAIGGGKIRLSKTAEAVLNFSYQVAEIGYNEITLTASQGWDGPLHLVELSMITPDLHITGSGDITEVKPLSPAAEPLSVELTFGVRDQTAELLTDTGLLSAKKDNLGYTLFNQPVHFGGTLQHLDVSHWHDLLFEAATRKPAPAETIKR